MGEVQILRNQNSEVRRQKISEELRTKNKELNILKLDGI